MKHSINEQIEALDAVLAELPARGRTNINPSGAPCSRIVATRALLRARAALEEAAALLDPVPDLLPIPEPEPEPDPEPAPVPTPTLEDLDEDED